MTRGEQITHKKLRWESPSPDRSTSTSAGSASTSPISPGSSQPTISDSAGWILKQEQQAQGIYLGLALEEACPGVKCRMMIFEKENDFCSMKVVLDNSTKDTIIKDNLYSFIVNWDKKEIAEFRRRGPRAEWLSMLWGSLSGNHDKDLTDVKFDCKACAYIANLISKPDPGVVTDWDKCKIEQEAKQSKDHKVESIMVNKAGMSKNAKFKRAVPWLENPHFLPSWAGTVAVVESWTDSESVLITLDGLIRSFTNYPKAANTPGGCNPPIAPGDVIVFKQYGIIPRDNEYDGILYAYRKLGTCMGMLDWMVQSSPNCATLFNLNERSPHKTRPLLKMQREEICNIFMGNRGGAAACPICRELQETLKTGHGIQ